MRNIFIALLLLCAIGVSPGWSQAVLPFFEGFENVGPTKTFTADDTLLNGSTGAGYYWQYDKTANGRLRFNAGTAFYAAGSAAATMDASPTGTNSINHLTLEINMLNYVGSYNLTLGFKYMNHGVDAAGTDNKVWVRGDSLSPWIVAYDLFANQAGTGVYKIVTGINVSALLATNNQVLTSSFQVRFGQQDDLAATSTSASDGYTFDDVTLTGNQPAANDGGISAIASLGSGCGLGAAQAISVTVNNFGTSPLITAPLSYSINGTTYGPETFTAIGQLNQGNSQSYTFTALANLATPGTYTIKAWTSVPGDFINTNDTAYLTITSIPLVNTFPYLENFDNATNPANGWTSGGTASTWALGTPAKTYINSAASAPNSWIPGGLTGTYNASELSWVKGPCFDLSSLVAPVVRVKIWRSAEFSWDGLVLQASTDGGATWSNVGVFGDPNNWYNDNTINGLVGHGGNQDGWTGYNASGSGGWVTAKHNLTGLGGQANVRLRFVFGSDTSIQYEGVAFDDVEVFDAPPVDAKGLAVISPGTACNLTSSETIGFTFTNVGSAALTSMPVSFSVNGVTVATETWTGSLAPFAQATHTFTTPANLSTLGATYVIKAWSTAANDGDVVNDTATTTLQHINGLSGTYTIDNTGTTSGTNYASFADATTALTTNGICNSVTFNVLNGPYNEQVSLGTVLGVSATKTITFDGGTGVKPILTYGSTATAARYTFRLNTSSYVTIRNLQIACTGNTTSMYGHGVQISGGSHYNVVENCDIRIDTTLTSANYAGIVVAGGVTGTITATSSTGTNSNNIIRYNTVNGGYYGLTNVGQTASYTTNNQFIGNTVRNSYYYSYYSFNADQAVVSQNSLSTRVSTNNFAYGIYGSSTTGGTYTRNRVRSTGSAGIYLTGVNSSLAATAPVATIANNFINYPYQGTSTVNGGIYIAGTSSKVNVWHNSVYTTGNTSWAMYNSTGTTSINIDIRNNIFVSNGTTGSALFVTNASTLSGLDYNLYYAPSNTAGNLASIGGALYTAANIVGGAGFNTNAKLGQPFFINAANGDLHTFNGQLWNAGANLGVTEDIDGDVRPLGLPVGYDIGADEFLPANKDGGVTALVAPVGGCGLGAAMDLVFNLGNFGLDSLMNFSVGYSVNGGTPGTAIIGDTLLPTQVKAITIPAAVDLSVPGTLYTIKIWSAVVGDLNGLNDTATFTVKHYNGLNGTYTIDNLTATGGTNFASFTAAATYLNTEGVCGPTLLNVLNGPYVEQVTLGNVFGSSAINTITFDGGTGVKPSLTTTTTTTNDRHVFKLNGTDYVTIRNLRMENTNNTTATWGFGVHLTGGATNNVIENNVIIVDTATTSANYAGVAISGDPGATGITATTTGNNPDNQILNNVIRGGYYGITVAGAAAPLLNSGTMIAGNTILKPYYYGLYLSNTTGINVLQNTVDMRVGNAFGYGIYSTTAVGINMQRNRIANSFYAGFYLTGVNAVTNVAPSTAYVVNNMVSYNYTGTSTTLGAVYLLGTINDLKFWHNSIYATGGTANALYNGTGTASTGIDIRNNSFMLDAATTGLNVKATNGGTMSVFDYNNFWVVGGTNLVQIGTTSYDATTVLGGGGFNANGKVGNPAYNLAPSDLHTISQQLWNAGDVAVGVTTDYDGDPRPLGLTPGVDMGADEFIPAGKDAAIAGIFSPSTGCGLSAAEDLSFDVSNYGADTIFALSVTYTVNGLNPVTTSYATAIPSGGAFTVVLSGVLNLSVPGTYVVEASVNVAGDANALNNSFSKTVTSIPVIASFPYFQNFDDPNNPAGGWVSGGTLNTWAMGTPAKSVINTAASAPNSWVTGGLTTGVYNNNEKSYVLGPCFDFTTLVLPVIELSYWRASENSWDGMVVQSSIDGGATWANVGAFGDPNNWYNDNSTSGMVGIGSNQDAWTGAGTGWVTGKHDLTGLGGNAGVQLRLVFGSDASVNSYNGVAFDDILIYDTPGKDVGVSQFLAPDAGCGDDSTAVIVEIKNFGIQPQFNIPVTVNWTTAAGGSGLISTVYTDTLAPGTVDTVIVGYLNTTGGGAYSFDGTTALVGDAIAQNDNKVFGPKLLGIIPAAPTGTDVYKCLADTFDLTVNAIAGTTYRWYDQPSGGMLLAEGDTLTQYLNATTTFYVDGRQSSPSSVGSPNTTVGTGGGNYTFYTGTGLIFNANSIVVIDSVTVYPFAAGNVELIVADAGGTVIGSVIRAVNPASANAAVVIPVGITVPAGVDYTMNSGNNTTCGGLWRNFGLTNYPQTDPLGQCTITNGSLNGYCYFFYNWKITVEGCPSERTPVTGGLFTPPSVSLGSDQFICDSAILTVSGNFNPIVFNSTVFNDSLVVTQAGIYDVFVTDANGCTARDTVVIQQNPIPMPNLGADSASCYPINLDGTGDPGDSYAWTTPAGASFSPTITAAITGSYLLTLTNMFGCTAYDTIQVTIFTPPTPALGNDQNSCTPVTLNAGVTGVQYLWSTGDTTQTIVASASGNNTYSVTATDPNGCAGADTIQVNIVAAPVVSLGADTTVCAAITLNAANPGNTYAWSTPGGAKTTQTVQTTTAGVYSVTVTNSIGCKGADTVSVAFAPQTVAGFSALPVGGNAQLVTFTNSSTGSDLSYEWDFGDPNVANDTSSKENPTYGYADPGFYEVVLVVKGLCGNDTLKMDLFVEYNATDMAFERSLTVFPNPTEGAVQVLSSERAVSLHVYDAQGREVRSGDLLPGQAQTIDLTSEAVGVYLFRFSDGVNETTRRVVVH